MRFRLVVDGEDHEIEVERSAPGLTVRVDGAPYRARVLRTADAIQVRLGKERHRIVIRGGTVAVDGQVHHVVTELAQASEDVGTRGTSRSRGAVFEIRPPMPGRVVRLPVLAGGAVKRGQAIAVLEAMKMQNEIPSPSDGVVREVRVREGETIGPDRVIAVIESS